MLLLSGKREYRKVHSGLRQLSGQREGYNDNVVWESVLAVNLTGNVNMNLDVSIEHALVLQVLNTGDSITPGCSIVPSS